MMKRNWWTAVLLVLVIAVGAILPVSALVEGKTLYTYNASEASGVWKRYSRGEWHYDAEGISCVNNDGRTGDDAWYYTWLDGASGWKNYVIDCDLNDVSEGGIIFRTSNPSDATVDAFDGYYCGTDSDYIFFGMDQDDKWKTIETDGPDASFCYKIGYKSAMHWTIRVEGNVYTLYLDHDKFPTAQVVDAGNTYAGGGIAVRYRVYPGDDSGCISNIKVTELTDHAGDSAVTASQTVSSSESASDSETTLSSEEATDNSASQNTEENQADDPETVEQDTEQVINTSGDIKLPAFLWVLFGIMAAGFVAVPVIMVVILIKDKKSKKTDEPPMA